MCVSCGCLCGAGQDVTLVVNGLRTFSHEAFRRVVYDKYIQTPEVGMIAAECLSHRLDWIMTLASMAVWCCS